MSMMNSIDNVVYVSAKCKVGPLRTVLSKFSDV